MNRPKRIKILSDAVLDLIAPKVPEPQREETEKESYIDAVLSELDRTAYKSGYYKSH